MKEAFGGGYFQEGTDHGVDMYLRVCSEVRCAPISQLVKGAADIEMLELAHRWVLCGVKYCDECIANVGIGICISHV